jgi:Transposase IS116/IS110/IS902 family
LTPKKYQSGETDRDGRISKIGDAAARSALYEAAHIILTMPVKGGWLKSWAAKLAKRAGLRKAKVALARRLAVILHRMWVDGKSFAFTAPKAVAAAAAWQGEIERFRAGHDTTPSRAKSRRRDDGSGQAAIRACGASDHAK